MKSQKEHQKSKKNSFPDEKTLKRVRDRLSDPHYEGSDLVIPASVSESDVAKYEICQLIAKYRREHGLKQTCGVK